VEVEFTKERAGKQNSKIIYKLSNSVPLSHMQKFM